jgi:hypothetical protein
MLNHLYTGGKMAECKCNYTTDEYNNCNGTHKVVKKFKEDLIKKIDEINIGESDNQLNALGMKMMVKDLLK